MRWKVQHAEKVGSQPNVILELTLIAANMVREGYHPGDSAVFGPGDSVLWVEHADRVVGVMCFQAKDDNTSYAWASLSWVAPDYRKRGVYRAMNAKLEEMAIKSGAFSVERFVVAGNTRMEKVLKRLGYKPTRTVWEKAIR